MLRTPELAHPRTSNNKSLTANLPGQKQGQTNFHTCAQLPITSNIIVPLQFFTKSGLSEQHRPPLPVPTIGDLPNLFNCPTSTRICPGAGAQVTLSGNTTLVASHNNVIILVAILKLLNTNN